MGGLGPNRPDEARAVEVRPEKVGLPENVRSSALRFTTTTLSIPIHIYICLGISLGALYSSLSHGVFVERSFEDPLWRQSVVLCCFLEDRLPKP